MDLIVGIFILPPFGREFFGCPKCVDSRENVGCLEGGRKIGTARLLAAGLEHWLPGLASGGATTPPMR